MKTTGLKTISRFSRHQILMQPWLHGEIAKVSKRLGISECELIRVLLCKGLGTIKDFKIENVEYLYNSTWANIQKNNP